MKKLTREELKNIKGGLEPPPPGCACVVSYGNPIDPDCYVGANSQLYCLPEEGGLVCC